MRAQPSALDQSSAVTPPWPSSTRGICRLRRFREPEFRIVRPSTSTDPEGSAQTFSHDQDPERTSEPHRAAVLRQSNVINLYEDRGSIHGHGVINGLGFRGAAQPTPPSEQRCMATITTL